MLTRICHVLCVCVHVCVIIIPDLFSTGQKPCFLRVNDLSTLPHTFGRGCLEGSVAMHVGVETRSQRLNFSQM